MDSTQQICSITLEPLERLKCPVSFAQDAHKHVFELEPLLAWLSCRPIHPISREPVLICDGFLIPLHADQSAHIQHFIHKQGAHI